MIKRTMQRSVQDRTVYSVGYVPSNKNSHLIIYGSVKTPFLVAEDMVKWLNLALPYQDILSIVDDSERMIKLIMGDDGKPEPKFLKAGISYY